MSATPGFKPKKTSLDKSKDKSVEEVLSQLEEISLCITSRSPDRISTQFTTANEQTQTDSKTPIKVEDLLKDNDRSIEPAAKPHEIKNQSFNDSSTNEVKNSGSICNEQNLNFKATGQKCSDKVRDSRPSCSNVNTSIVEVSEMKQSVSIFKTQTDECKTQTDKQKNPTSLLNKEPVKVECCIIG